MKKTVVIDIGSNSVRKQVFSGGNVLLREVITCQLSLGIKDKKLANKSINRTFEALDRLILCELNCENQLFAFATACVRNSVNGGDFCKEFFARYKIKLNVLSGEEEAETGILGALSGGDGTVIDVGGASSEIAAASGGKIIYSHSMQDGAVTLTDAFLKDRQAAEKYLDKIKEHFKSVTVVEPVYAIGGTANTLAFIGAGLESYDAEKSEGYVLSIDELQARVNDFYLLSPNEIANKYKIEQKRANVIHSGALILLGLVKHLGVSKIILTENDNLYGYYLKKTKGKKYEK